MQQHAENEYPAEAEDEDLLMELWTEQAIAYGGYDFFIPAEDDP